MEEVREIIFYGRSGDGVNVVADRFVQDLIRRGFYAVAYPEFDPERRETPAKVHVRVSKGPFDVRGPVTKPEIAVVLDIRAVSNSQEILGARKIIVNAPNRELVTKYLGNTDAEVIHMDLHSLRKTGADYTPHVIESLMKLLSL